MSFLAGFVQQMNTIRERNDRFREQEADRAERREMFMQKLIADQRNALIPVLLEERAEANEFLRQEKQKQAFLIGTAKLSPSTVAVLTQTGQDDMVIKTVQSAIDKGEYDPRFARDLDELVNSKIEELGLDKANLGRFLAEGLYGVNTKTEEGRAVSVTQALQSMLTTDKPFETAEDMLSIIKQSTAMREDMPTIAGVNINLGAASAIPTTELERIRKTLLQTTASKIDPEKFVDGEYTGKEGRLQDLLAILEEEVIDRSARVGSTMSISDALSLVRNDFLNTFNKEGLNVFSAYGIGSPVKGTIDTVGRPRDIDADPIVDALGGRVNLDATSTTPVVPVVPTDKEEEEDIFTQGYQGRKGN